MTPMVLKPCPYLRMKQTKTYGANPKNDTLFTKTKPKKKAARIGRGLHRYRSGQGFESGTSLNFSGFLFATAKVAYITAMIFIHIIGTLSVRITPGTQRQQRQKR